MLLRRRSNPASSKKFLNQKAGPLPGFSLDMGYYTPLYFMFEKHRGPVFPDITLCKYGAINDPYSPLTANFCNISS